MQALLDHVTTRLATHRYVNIFDQEILRTWPLTDPEAAAKELRKQAILDFAALHGLIAHITDLGLRVAFTKPPQVKAAAVLAPAKVA